jgi:hypothetical protein
MPLSNQLPNPHLLDLSVNPQTVVNYMKHEIIHGVSCLFPLQLKDEICVRLLKVSRKETQFILGSSTVNKTNFSGGHSFDVHRTN